MPVHLPAAAAEPLPAPAPSILDIATPCLSLDTKPGVADWRRPSDQSELCLLGAESSGVLSLLVESLPTPQCDRKGSVLLTWRIGALPTRPNIRSHDPDGFQCQSFLGNAACFQISFKT